MTADTLLAKLEKVRKRGTDQWSARCPAHDDKGPSLSVRALADGRTLLHCFAGCGADEVLGAVGLEMDELFPPKAAAGAGTAPQPLRLPASQAIAILERETVLVALIGGDMVRKKGISEIDHRRLIQAVSRVQFVAQETKR